MFELLVIREDHADCMSDESEEHNLTWTFALDAALQVQQQWAVALDISQKGYTEQSSSMCSSSDV